MLTTAAIASILLLAPQDSVPATPIKPAPAAPAAEAKPAVAPLSVGDPAPAFKVDTWVKGESFDGIEKGKVHVMEFWATWCGPCITAIPHLTELQKKYPEVRFVGVAASESTRNTTAEERLAKVKSFVDGKGDTMGYRVVFVDDRAKMGTPWMEAAGQRGIPCTFIVDSDAKVAWIGHPMGMDEPLAQIVAGSWDLDAARAEFVGRRAAEEAQGRMRVMMRDASRTGDYAPVVAAMKEMLAKSPNDGLKMQLFTVLAGPAGQPAEAWKLGEELIDANGGNAMMMNQLAWMIVDPESPVKEKNLDLALKAAEAANKASKGEDASIMDTLARVHFVRGDAVLAVEIRKAAIEKAPAGRMKEDMKTALAEYEAAIKKG